MRVAVLLIISSALNYHLKNLFDLPRPIVDFPDLAMLSFRSPGLPSGGAQMATCVGGLLIYGWKSPWGWVIGILFAALICFSRLYLGVHYPMDVIAGIIIGLAVLLPFIYSVQPIEKFCAKQRKGFCLACVTIVCLIYSFYSPDPLNIRLAAALWGFSFGVYLSSRFLLSPKHPPALWIRIVHACITIIIVFILYALTSHALPRPIQAFMIALWISFGAGFLLRAKSLLY